MDVKNKLIQGFTLVELMVGLLISLSVGAVAVTYLITSSRILASQNAENVIQENTRFAFEILSSSIRLAGLNTSVNAQTFLLDKPFIFTGAICAANLDCNTDNQSHALNSQPTNANIETDTVAFSYIADFGTTCTGAAITVEQQVVTQFFVADLDADDVYSLYCQSYVAFQDVVTQNFINHLAPKPSVALIDGVEALQVQFGVDRAEPADFTVNSYVSYQHILPDDLGNIRSVKIALLFSNAQDDNSLAITENEFGSHTYYIQNGTVTTDRRVLRKVASTTVFLPNS